MKTLLIGKQGESILTIILEHSIYVIPRGIIILHMHISSMTHNKLRVAPSPILQITSIIKKSKMKIHR